MIGRVSFRAKLERIKLLCFELFLYERLMFLLCFVQISCKRMSLLLCFVLLLYRDNAIYSLFCPFLIRENATFSSLCVNLIREKATSLLLCIEKQHLTPEDFALFLVSALSLTLRHYPSGALLFFMQRIVKPYC